jgi:hypothetical protein
VVHDRDIILPEPVDFAAMANRLKQIASILRSRGFDEDDPELLQVADRLDDRANTMLKHL